MTMCENFFQNLSFRFFSFLHPNQFNKLSLTYFEKNFFDFDNPMMIMMMMITLRRGKIHRD